MVLYCSYYWTSIKPVNWTAILAATQSNQSTILAVTQSNPSTGQPSWQSLNQTKQLDSHPGSHSIKPASESWRPVGRLEGGSGGAAGPPGSIRRRRRFPNNSGHLAEPWSNVPRKQISRSGNPSLRSEFWTGCCEAARV